MGRARYSRDVRRALAFVVVCAACGPKHAATDGGLGDDAGNIDGSTFGLDGRHDDAQQCGTLTATLRDFQSTHPDFEHALGDDRGLVKADLGGDNKPVYAPAGATGTVSGQASFDQWYRDVAGTNLTFTQDLPLTEDPPGTFTFDDETFFPLDGLGFPETFVGGDGQPHNFHFTTEIHSSFTYKGGEVFTFTGDDDVFVFVNKKLALDLGGVHAAESQTIDFDAQAGALGIAVGDTYQLDVFHAERHTVDSHFRMATTIDCFVVIQ